MTKPIRETQYRNPTERVAAVTMHLYRNGQVSTAEAAQMIGVTRTGAARLLDKLSLVLPVYEDGGVWRLLQEDGEE